MTPAERAREVLAPFEIERRPEVTEAVAYAIETHAPQTVRRYTPAGRWLIGGFIIGVAFLLLFGSIISGAWQQ